jgi:pyruvate/2-oxoacid:ferredoxin oxidoreductase beta subunit
MIIAAHKVPYVATASVAYPIDLKRKLEKAMSIKGFKFIHTIIPCPTGWRFDPAKAVEVTRLGVDSWVTPLYEIEEGVLKVSRKAEAKPVNEYLSAQGRFRRLSEEQIAYIQSEVDAKRDDLLAQDGKKIIH